MDNGENILQRQQACRIQLTFPTTTDEQAISVKQQIEKVVSDIKGAQIQFSLLNIPATVPSI